MCFQDKKKEETNSHFCKVISLKKIKIKKVNKIKINLAIKQTRDKKHTAGLVPVHLIMLSFAYHLPPLI